MKVYKFCGLLAGFIFPLLLSVYGQDAEFYGERSSFNKGWRFQLGHAYSSHNDMFLYGNGDSHPFTKSGRMEGVNSEDFDDSGWRQVDLPHDWAIELDFINDPTLADYGFKPVGWKFPETSLGWYRKVFEIPATDRDKKIFIKFDGVYRDCDMWLNGFYLGNNLSGYMEFMYDLTDMIRYGEKNILVARVNATQNEGWWYEGAGIYRHTWLIKKSLIHIPEYGTYITTDVGNNNATVHIQTDMVNEYSTEHEGELHLQIVNDAGEIIGTAVESFIIGENASETFFSEISVSNPKLWSVERPILHKLISTVKLKKTVLDQTETTFGIRTIAFDAEKGFLLNGKPTKLKGAAMHQDHAGVGVALPDRLQYYRIERLKSMGCNAYRSAHHPPTTELLDACDRLGMLVVAETRLLTGSPEYLNQWRRLILRDRNHPSVIIWSLGNEEMNIHNTERGKRIAKTFKRIQRELDPSRLCTYSGNNANHYEGINEVVDVRGFSYMNLGDIDKYHQDHPDQPVMGTEEAGTLCTRGQYLVDKEQGYMSDYDKKENAVYGWCANAEEWWKFYDEREWLAGGFIWTGMDYRGEPAPYRWPCVNSHFGVMDMCGYPKNNYYYYKAWWTNEDVLHIYPHWNWPGKIGDTINVWCQSNCENVELFLNGISQGKRKIEKNSHVEWDVVYEPGTLEARGTKGGRQIIKKIETTGPAAKIIITPDRETIKADGKDVSVLNVTVIDNEGREVPDAFNFITFKTEGDGKIIGVGNGDPSSHEPDKILHGNYFRRLFNGKCQVILQSTEVPGEITVLAVSDNLEDAEIRIRTVR